VLVDEREHRRGPTDLRDGAKVLGARWAKSEVRCPKLLPTRLLFLEAQRTLRL
jgi:hypothetical protein